MKLRGAVLVGGASRRMGSDKSLLIYNGVALGRRSVDAIHSAGVTHVVAVGGSAAHESALGVASIADEAPSAGPLGAVVTALHWADGDPVVILPCDLPAITGQALAPFVQAPLPAGVRLARREGRMAYPSGVWSPALIGHLDVAFAAGARSFVDALGDAVIETVDVGPEFDDADDPGALRRARYREAMNAIPEIDIETFTSRRAEGAVVIDVREVGEYEEAHVPGAILIPLGELAERVAEVPLGEPVLVICRSGARSMKACEILAAGNREASNVGGGTLAWIASGGEVATGMERG